MHPNLKNSDNPTCFGQFTNWEPIPMISIFDFCEIIDPVYNDEMVLSLLHEKGLVKPSQSKLNILTD